MRRVFGGIWLIVCLCGCGGRVGPEIAEVHGTLTLDGDPIEGASVVFHPEFEGTRPAVCTTNAEGRFALTTYDPGDGAFVGKHRVTVSKIIDPLGPQERELFPRQFTVATISPLDAVVESGKLNEFEFDVTLDAGRNKRP